MGGLRSRVIAGGAIAILATALLVATAHARDCVSETPLPADVKLTSPGANVPADRARFAGAWTGVWDGDVCSTLVVEDVFANGVARVVYSRGTSEALNIRQPGSWRATGRIADGVLRFTLPTVARPDFEYRYRSDGDTLSGTARPGVVDRKISMGRAPDISTIGCSSRTNRPATPASGSRDRLTAADLLASNRAGPLVHNDYFMPVGGTGPARHALRGTITVSAGTVASAYRECNGLPVPTPAFTVAVLTHGEHLVPVVRGFLPPSQLVIVSPGRIWSEPGDQGMSRASFPFLVVDGTGAHNGLGTFVFDDTRVSNLGIQITQETAEWARNDLWGTLSMTYTPGVVADEAAVRREFDAERQREVPVKPWSALPASARGPALDGLIGEVTTEDVSASGLVIDGVVYLHGCNTRTGPFPYCRHMRHAAFSVTKSLGGAIALLRLAQKYGDGVFDAKIADYLTVTATHDGWKDVTFADALNMATGIGERSPRREPNDSRRREPAAHFEWLGKRSLTDKLDAAFAYPKYPWARNEVFRYNTTHTFVLAAAMDAYLKRREGPTAHLWDMVVEEVYRPIGVFHAPMLHTIEADGSRGVPILGYGLYPTIDDVAKLTTLLQNGGRHDGRQLLPAPRIAEALYPSGDTAGLPLGPTSSIRRSALPPVVLVDSVPDRRRLLLPDPVHVGLRRQHGHAVAERCLRVPVRGCDELRQRVDGARCRGDSSILHTGHERRRGTTEDSAHRGRDPHRGHRAHVLQRSRPHVLRRERADLLRVAGLRRRGPLVDHGGRAVLPDVERVGQRQAALLSRVSGRRDVRVPPGRSMVRRDRQARTRQSGALLTQARSERPPGLAVPTAPAGIQPENSIAGVFSAP